MVKKQDWLAFWGKAESLLHHFGQITQHGIFETMQVSHELIGKRYFVFTVRFEGIIFSGTEASGVNPYVDPRMTADRIHHLWDCGIILIDTKTCNFSADIKPDKTIAVIGFLQLVGRIKK